MSKQSTAKLARKVSGDSKGKKLSRRQVLTGGTAGLAGLALTGAGLAGAQTAPDTLTSQNRFTDRVVLITGATSGIGEVTARTFAREGASVFFCGRRAQLGRQVEAAINADEAVIRAGW